MISIIKEARIINKYLCQIKKNLPLWVRLRKDELNCILDEIEEHIWEKAIEYAGDKEPNEIDIQVAISQMGEPQDIASKFTSKSTPYIYISEELYPSYKKYRKIIFWSLLLWLIVFFMQDPFTERYFNFVDIILNLLITLSTLFTLIGIIFCYLSITGYFPYELRKSKIQKRYSTIVQIQKPKFKSPFQIIILLLEISFLLFIGLVFIWSFPQILTFFILSLIKFLRVSTKRKSVIWQRLLILLDVFLMVSVIYTVGGLLYNYNLYELQEILSFLPILFFFYVCYEVYIFTTLRDKIELYLKKLSLVKRISKKESILRDMENKDLSTTQNSVGKSCKYNYEIEKELRIYLKKARRKLPFWLKTSEKRDIIQDIEEEIREAILEFEESSKLTEKNFKQLLPDLGSIKTRLFEYKQRGTPRIYISKELWPWYLIIIKAVLVYFIIIEIFIIVLQLSFNAAFSSIFQYFRLLLLLWICILILVSRIFTFLSLNDFIPGKKEFLTSKKKIVVKDHLYYIWETLFAVIYIAIGIIILYGEVSLGEFSTNLRGFLLILLNIVLILLLGGIKSLKMVFKRKKVILKSVLIILSIELSLVINFFILYSFIHSTLSLNMFALLLLPINIEIIYEIFHFFFKEQKEKSINEGDIDG